MEKREGENCKLETASSEAVFNGSEAHREETECRWGLRFSGHLEF